MGRSRYPPQKRHPSKRAAGADSGQLFDDFVVDLLLDEICFLEWNMENPFLEGLEIRVEIPRVLQQYRNSFALYLYRDVTPLPSLQEYRYQATQVTFHILPTQSLFSFKVPLDRNHGLIKDATSAVSPPIPRSSYPLLLTLLPIMKGIPDDSYAYPLSVSIHPIFRNEGGLKLEILNRPVSEEVKLIIDGVSLSIPDGYIPLGPGLHSLSISTDHSGVAEYRIEIERGKMTELIHQIKVEPSSIEIPAMEGVVFLLDGEETEGGRQSLPPGEYLLEARLNEGLSIRKTVALAAGENLLVTLDFILDVRNQ